MNIAERSLNQRHKFRVIIVGLFPRQFEEIASEFPGLDLRHVPQGSAYDTSQLYRNADRIMVMTKFIGHDLSDKVRNSCDPRNIIWNHGAFSAARNELAKLESQAKLLADQKVISLPIREASGIYRIDFSALRHAKTGETLTYTRPETMPAHNFESEITNALGYYKKECGVRASHHVSGGKVTITVERGVNHLENAEAALLESFEREAPESARNTKRFWRDVYLESYRSRPLADAAEHVAFADAAMAGWLSLFPTE